MTNDLCQKIERSLYDLFFRKGDPILDEEDIQYMSSMASKFDIYIGFDVSKSSVSGLYLLEGICIGNVLMFNDNNRTRLFEIFWCCDDGNEGSDLVSHEFDQKESLTAEEFSELKTCNGPDSHIVSLVRQYLAIRIL